MKITNTAAGPRGVLTASGETVYIESGQTADVEVATGHKLYEGLKSARDAKAESSEPKALSAMNKAELLEAAAADGVTIALDADGKEIPVGDATNKQIAAAIEKKRAAA